MRRSDLAALQRPNITVRVGGNEFTLHPPTWQAYNELQKTLARYNKEKDLDHQADIMMESMVLAVLATLEFDGEDEPPVTRDEAQAVIFNTGMHSSPIVKGAMEQCGIPWTTGEDAQDEGELDPTADNPFS